jgi:hypothetical protein
MCAVLGGAVVLMGAGLSALIVHAGAIGVGIFAGLAAGSILARSVPSRRLRLDVWLAAWVPAAAITAWMLVGRWPIRQRSSNAHGWGMHGGESNVLLLPVVQLVLFIAGMILVARLRAGKTAV